MNSIGGIGSGAWDPNQFISKANERFQSADVNNDGAVSKDEFLENTQQIPSSSKAEKMFARVDSDGDGVITKGEHEAALQRIEERMDKMSSSNVGQSQSLDNFRMLLESMSNSEVDTEKSNTLQEILKQANSATEDNDFNGLREALLEFNQIYPSIDLSV